MTPGRVLLCLLGLRGHVHRDLVIFSPDDEGRSAATVRAVELDFRFGARDFRAEPAAVRTSDLLSLVSRHLFRRHLTKKPRSTLLHVVRGLFAPVGRSTVPLTHVVFRLLLMQSSEKWHGQRSCPTRGSSGPGSSSSSPSSGITSAAASDIAWARSPSENLLFPSSACSTSISIARM